MNRLFCILHCIQSEQNRKSDSSGNFLNYFCLCFYAECQFVLIEYRGHIANFFGHFEIEKKKYKQNFKDQRQSINYFDEINLICFIFFGITTPDSNLKWMKHKILQINWV